jgi:hypothetical protein
MKFKECVVIDQPVDTVFSFATDLRNNSLWQTDIIVAEQTSDGPFGRGATYRCVNKFMGQRIETEGIITDFEPKKKCGFKFISGPITGESSYFFEPISESTRFTASGDLNVNLLSIAKWIVSHFAKEQIRNDLWKLKKILENGYRKKM